MIVKPKIRGFICTTSHPKGCAKNVQDQIDYIKSQSAIMDGPKKVLVIGSSTGYGLASRIVATFACQADTIGVYYEKTADKKRTATSGLYNSVAFLEAAQKYGCYAKNINGDAYSDEIKQEVISAIKEDLGKIDLIIYSLASPRRLHPKTGKISKSTLKPRQGVYTNKSIDFDKDEIINVTLNAATEEEIQQTVDVMGGEDWEMWIDVLEKADVLSENVMTIAYSYVGPKVTRPVYRNGTIGAAKDHLEATARKINQRLEKLKGKACVSVNKALVTQSSAAIPFIPLYFILLTKVMKEKGVHEDCIQQIYRLFHDRLYTGGDIPVDDQGRIRIDDFEMREDVQDQVDEMWQKVNNDNLHQLADIQGYHKDFLKMFGFGLPEVDYEAEVTI